MVSRLLLLRISYEEHIAARALPSRGAIEPVWASCGRGFHSFVKLAWESEFGAEMMKLPAVARHRALRHHGALRNFKMDQMTQHEPAARPGAHRHGTRSAANPPPGLPAPVQPISDVPGALPPQPTHSPGSDTFYDIFGCDDLPSTASTEQLARTDRVGRGLLNDASSTDIRAPQEHGRGMDACLESEESCLAVEQKRRCDDFGTGAAGKKSVGIKGEGRFFRRNLW